tara:strand:+ start:1201 stop:1401 length:201 start_codon:yes stop_codon:yes gene_type:complete
MLIYYERRKDGSHELLDELKKLRTEKVKQANASLDKVIESGDAKQIKQAKEKFLKEVGINELEYLD